MLVKDCSQLQYELESRVQARTGRRVRNLAVELQGGRVVLRGETTSYYVKQLAQHGVQDILPKLHLENTIKVQSEARVVEWES